MTEEIFTPDEGGHIEAAEKFAWEALEFVNETGQAYAHTKTVVSENERKARLYAATLAWYVQHLITHIEIKDGSGV